MPHKENPRPPRGWAAGPPVPARRLTSAAHRAGMPVWGHAWVQPASVAEQSAAGMDGVVHAAGLAGELFSADERNNLVNDGDLQTATAKVATSVTAQDPRVLATLDSMAARGTMFEPTLDATRHSLVTFDARTRHVPSLQEGYVRAAAQFGVEVTREAIKRGVRISAGSDHVAYGPISERASLFGELQLLVDSIALSDRHDRGRPLRRSGAPQQESAGRHRESRSGGLGDARRQDLAAGTASERDRDAVARADPPSLPAAIGSRPTPSMSPRRSGPGDSRAGTAG